MTSSGSLTPFQEAVLRAFFRRESRFFLTGGAALVGYHLHHRTTTDIDLFTLDREAHAVCRHVLSAVAEELSSGVETVREAPGYLRCLLHNPDGALVVDLVLERVPQAHGPKLDFGGVRVDPPEEILANKLTTLLSRSEERDLVDVMALERAGHRVEDALDAAFAKDGGCTPAQLAFVLSGIRVPDGAVLPAGVAPLELRTYVIDLVRRLRRAALPASGPGRSQ